MSVHVSAPAKLILMGEHAAVYGRPALVTAVDLRLDARLRRPQTPTAGVRLDVPALGVAEELSWELVRATVERLRDSWLRYMEAPGPESFRALAAQSSADAGAAGGPGSGAARLLAVALGETAHELGETAPEPVSLTIDSAIPVGSGLGSSAAAAVAVVTAYLAHRGALVASGLDAAARRRIHRISLEVERRQHGSPSGVDNATVLEGGLLRARRLPVDGPGATDRAVELTPLEARSPLLERLEIVGSGAPAESTGTVVAAVAALRATDAGAFEARWDELEELTDRFQSLLEAPEERPEETCAVIRRAEALLEELGVVPEPARRLVRAVEAAGGAAKISGAGSLSGPGAGILVLYHPDRRELARLEPLAALPRYPCTLGAPGVRIEGS